jgi:hypothetical protein
MRAMRIQLAHTIGASSGAVSCNQINEVLIIDLSSGVYFGVEGGSEAMVFMRNPGGSRWTSVRPTQTDKLVRRSEASRLL